MGFKSKTYSLSDEVIAEIERAKVEKRLSPNRFLLHLLRTVRRITEDLPDSDESRLLGGLVVELDNEGDNHQ